MTNTCKGGQPAEGTMTMNHGTLMGFRRTVFSDEATYLIWELFFNTVVFVSAWEIDSRILEPGSHIA